MASVTVRSLRMSLHGDLRRGQRGPECGRIRRVGCARGRGRADALPCPAYRKRRARVSQELTPISAYQGGNQNGHHPIGSPSCGIFLSLPGGEDGLRSGPCMPDGVAAPPSTRVNVNRG